MTEKHTDIQAVELSDQDLDMVAGGSGLLGGAIANANSVGAAVGNNFAFTDTKTETFAISLPHQQAAGSGSSSTSVAF